MNPAELLKVSEDNHVAHLALLQQAEDAEYEKTKNMVIARMKSPGVMLPIEYDGISQSELQRIERLIKELNEQYKDPNYRYYLEKGWSKTRSPEGTLFRKVAIKVSDGPSPKSEKEKVIFVKFRNLSDYQVRYVQPHQLCFVEPGSDECDGSTD
jgi:hypothetical protein